MSWAHDWFSDRAYAGGWRLITVLPRRPTAAAFGAAADLAVRRNGRGVTRLRGNLRLVLGPQATEGELDATVRLAMRSYARYWFETFRLPRMAPRDVLAGVVTEGAEHIDAAMAGGRGVILALPHCGNWDVAGIWLVERGIHFTTVAERLRPAALFDRFVAYREGLGMEILALDGGSRPPLEVLTERLRAGGCVCLVADRDLTSTGVEVTFFGEAARMPVGPALLAATTGAALLPVAVYYTDDGWGQWIGPPIDSGAGRLRERVTRATQAMADCFAQRIAAHPADWHMLQTVWPVDRSAPVEHSA